ncbi:hypothetical protein JCM6882_003242 [Rhodosporidiobolus microsporus]
MANSSRQSILFDSETTFSSPDEFFFTCRAALRNAYRWPAEISRRDSSAAAMRCGLRLHMLEPCPFRVLYRPANGGQEWVLDEEKSCWDHSHDAGKDGGEDMDEKVEGEEAKEEEEEEGLDPATSEAKITSCGGKGNATTVQQLFVPKFPSPTTTFSSFQALHFACALALIPVYGMSCDPPTGRATGYLQCSRAHSRSHVGPEGPSPPPPPPVALTAHPFFHSLTAFLAALHPSLSPLAACLLAVGVGSSDALAALALCEAEIVGAFVDRVRGAAGGGAKPSAIQVKLLVKALKERTREAIKEEGA